MAGHHIEREARYEATGMTELQRDQLIVRLRRRGWTQARIAKELGMSQPAISHRLRWRIPRTFRNRLFGEHHERWFHQPAAADQPRRVHSYGRVAWNLVCRPGGEVLQLARPAVARRPVRPA